MVKAATPKQMEFLRTLYREAKERVAGAPEDQQATLQTMLEEAAEEAAAGLRMEDVTPLVQRFKAIRPAAPVPATKNPKAQSFAAVEPGRYALHDVAGKIHFFRVKAGTKNPAIRFVNEQASDSYHPVGKARAMKILARIQRDPHAAQMLYAGELGRCYSCGRTLTDEKSRQLGIGPVCRGEA